MVASALTLVCAVVAGVAASAAGNEMTRGPNEQEIRHASAEEVARRWWTWPAGRIFPERLDYTTEQGGTERARRVGISSRTDCSAAVDAVLRPGLAAAGCQAVLRATYLDALQGIVVTLGVAAFPSEGAAARAAAVFPSPARPAPGLRALAFPGTVTDRFTAAGRQFGYLRQSGPYLVLATAGQVDGRPARSVGKRRESMFTFAGDMADRVLSTLATPVTPDCASPDWKC